MFEEEEGLELAEAVKEVIKTMAFTQRLGSSRTLQRAYPGWGTCFRCQCPWSVVEPCIVQFDAEEGGWKHGAFAVCVLCWAELGNAKERIPYYHALVKQWDEDNSVEDVQGTMDSIAAAVVTASLEEMEGAGQRPD